MTERRRLWIAAVRCVPPTEKPERGGTDDDPQILHYLGRYEVGLPRTDDNPQFVTKSEDSRKTLEERLLRGKLDQPVVEVSTHTDTQRMEYSRNRSHDLGEDLRSRGEAKARSFELVDRVT